MGLSLQKVRLLYLADEEKARFQKCCNLFDCPASEWKVHRRLVTPLINSTSLQAYYPIFDNQIRKTVANLPVSDDFFDVLPHLLSCTITMFTEAALGSKIEPSAKQKYMRRFKE